MLSPDALQFSLLLHSTVALNQLCGWELPDNFFNIFFYVLGLPSRKGKARGQKKKKNRKENQIIRQLEIFYPSQCLSE